MALKDKILFWRHNEPDIQDELGLNQDNLGLDKDSLGAESDLFKTDSSADNPEMQDSSFGSSSLDIPSSKLSKPSFDRTFQQPKSAERDFSKDLEIISLKLDALKSILENINQRLSAIEKIAREGV